jgi:acetolactate synthase-1/2/3 large subunit
MSSDQKIGGHLLVECLVAQGVTHAFGVPGESYLAVLDGFHRHREHIEFIINRQEGGAAFMAEAHGKLTGRPVFVGDVAAPTRDREAFQEVDYLSFFGPSTKGFAKRVERIDDVQRIPEYVARAFATAMNGRPGPVVLVLPEDMLTQPILADALTHALPQVMPRLEPVEAWSAPGALRTLREMLLKAERPLVIAGGGGWTVQAAQALQRFAENWKLPVGTMPFASRTFLTITTRCTPEMWALASARVLLRVFRTAT